MSQLQRILHDSYKQSGVGGAAVAAPPTPTFENSKIILHHFDVG